MRTIEGDLCWSQTLRFEPPVEDQRKRSNNTSTPNEKTRNRVKGAGKQKAAVTGEATLLYKPPRYKVEEGPGGAEYKERPILWRRRLGVDQLD